MTLYLQICVLPADVSCSLTLYEDYVQLTTFDGKVYTIETDVPSGGEITLLRYYAGSPEMLYSRVTWVGKRSAIKLNSKYDGVFYLAVMSHDTKRGKVQRCNTI